MGPGLHSKNLTALVIMVTLAACAFLSARGATQLLAARVMPLSGEPIALASGPRGERPPGAELPDPKAILKRNAFDSETGPLWPPKAPEPDVVEEAEGETVNELAPGEMPPACDGALRFVASIYRPSRPEWSVATLATGKDSPLLYRAGATVGDKTVDSIYPQAVFLKGSDGLCSVTLFADNSGKPAPGKAAKPAAKPTPKPAARSGGVAQNDLDQNITKVSDTNYKVNRTLIDKLLSNQAELMRSARVVPHQQNGQTVGVKLYGIRRKSVLGHLGLQNGDLLRTINGFNMASPDSALEAYTKLRSASNLSVSVTRRGRDMTLDYSID